MYQLQEEERMIIKMVDDVCTDVLADRAADIDEADEFPEDVYTMLVEQGLFSLVFKEDFGGFSLSYQCWSQVISRLAQESPAVALMLFVSTVASDPIATFGSDALKADILPRVATGETKMSFAMTEPAAGSNTASMSTTAKPSGDGYVINGNKIFISNASVADYFAVFAKVDDGADKKPACFLVPKDAPGVTVSAKENKLGLHGSPTCPLFFENVQVPAQNLIGEVGQGDEIAHHALNCGRIAVAAASLGIAKASLAASAAYALDRKQFGCPIADFQAISFMIADMEAGIEAAELLLDQACSSFAENAQDVMKRVSTAKLFCTELAQKSALDAVQIHGGYGFVKEYPVERYYRDAKAFTIIEGSSQMQRKLISRAVLKDYAQK